MTLPLEIPQAEIEAFCQRHHIRRLSLFGSVLRDDFGPHSDVDVLVEYEPDHITRLDHLLAAEKELSVILQREVDFGEQRSVEEDPNYLRRKHILSTAQVIYERWYGSSPGYADRCTQSTAYSVISTHRHKLAHHVRLLLTFLKEVY